MCPIAVPTFIREASRTVQSDIGYFLHDVLGRLDEWRGVFNAAEASSYMNSWQYLQNLFTFVEESFELNVKTLYEPGREVVKGESECNFA